MKDNEDNQGQTAELYISNTRLQSSYLSPTDPSWTPIRPSNPQPWWFFVTFFFILIWMIFLTIFSNPSHSASSSYISYLHDVPSLISNVSPPLFTLGARGHLPRWYIVSSLWVLKQFAPTLPSESMLGTFWKYPSIHPWRTHQVRCGFFVKEPIDFFAPNLPGRAILGVF